jgi:hypothetical protein
MAKVNGTIRLSGLPPHRGLILNVCFYKVSGFEAPPPYGGDPPATAAVDIHKVSEDVHLETESRQTDIEKLFALEHEPGYFYVEVRPILFREGKESMLAQAEQFFFGRRPLRVSDESQEPVTLPVAWPQMDVADLHHYGTLKPQSGWRALWRFLKRGILGTR